MPRKYKEDFIAYEGARWVDGRDLKPLAKLPEVVEEAIRARFREDVPFNPRIDLPVEEWNFNDTTIERIMLAIEKDMKKLQRWLDPETGDWMPRDIPKPKKKRIIKVSETERTFKNLARRKKGLFSAIRRQLEGKPLNITQQSLVNTYRRSEHAVSKMRETKPALTFRKFVEIVRKHEDSVFKNVFEGMSVREVLGETTPSTEKWDQGYKVDVVATNRVEKPSMTHADYAKIDGKGNRFALVVPTKEARYEFWIRRTRVPSLRTVELKALNLRGLPTLFVPEAFHHKGVALKGEVHRGVLYPNKYIPKSISPRDRAKRKSK